MNKEPTDLQLEILQYLADGWTVRRIAGKLHWSEGTVRTHLYAAYRLLCTCHRDPIQRAHVVALALRKGLIK